MDMDMKIWIANEISGGVEQKEKKNMLLSLKHNRHQVINKIAENLLDLATEYVLSTGRTASVIVNDIVACATEIVVYLCDVKFKKEIDELEGSSTP